jgi:protein-histidine pros-kinase
LGDAGRLRQVLLNLVGNAVKFTAEGSVELRVTLVEGRVNEIRFEVADTGVGIAADKTDRIFDAFAQGDSSTTRRYGGSGLGLAISARLVEAMGGRIEVESAEGVGSTFTFTARLPAATPDAVPSGAGIAAGGRVLVVAGPGVGGQLIDLVEGAGLSPYRVADEAQALVALERARVEGAEFSVVVVDVADPVDGLPKVLLGSDATSAIPMAVLVGAGKRGDASRCRRAGVRAYLTKPVSVTELAEALDAICSPEFEPGVLVTRHWLREQWGSRRLLLADDSATNRLLATRILEGHGHTVVGVPDGRAAVESFAKEAFDLILMDVQMPEVDGLAATEAIREIESERGGHIPIVALTAHAMAEDRERCLAAGMDEYLAKPFKADELLQTVARMVRIHHDGEQRVPEPEEYAPVLDRKRAVASADGDGELLTALASTFLSTYSSELRTVYAAIESGDGVAVAPSIERLTEGFSLLGAARAAQAVGALGAALAVADTAAVLEARDDLDDVLIEAEPELSALAQLGVAAWRE